MNNILYIPIFKNAKIKYRNIFALAIIILLGILIWRTSMVFINITGLVSNSEISSDSELSIKTTVHKETITLNESSQGNDNIADNGNFSAYDTIEETIARIKQDVYVTGTIIGTPGQETALFQIEGMADLSFKINTQLMDGFIIKQITNDKVILKNQIGEETIELWVTSKASY